MSAKHRRLRHPVQPIEWDGKGVLRFKSNPIVRHLLDAGPFDLNTLHHVPGFTSYDWDQFNQLIGYSVSACPIRSKVTLFDADVKAEQYLAKWPEDPEVKR